jgi:hypothetical protein
MQQNITVSADNSLVQKARARANALSTTLEDEFQRWLEDYAREEADSDAWFAQQIETMQKLRHMSA